MVLSMLRRVLGNPPARLDDEQLADRRLVLDHPVYEVVPIKTAAEAIADLPAASKVTVTCSPVKGIDATLDLCESIAALGHSATPHLAARMVEPDGHIDRIVHRLETLALTEVFVIAGDAEEPHGNYAGAVHLMEDLVEKAPFLTHIGFAGYPDGHAFIDDHDLHEALHAKQALLAQAGVSGHVSTQMCFDPDTIRRWLTAERTAGFELPVHLGMAGVVDRARLLTMGMRLGVGTSLRFLNKNRDAITRLLTSPSYEPTTILDELAGDLGPLGVEAMHLFTFNQVSATASWLAARR